MCTVKRFFKSTVIVTSFDKIPQPLNKVGHVYKMADSAKCRKLLLFYSKIKKQTPKEKRQLVVSQSVWEEEINAYSSDLRHLWQERLVPSSSPSFSLYVLPPPSSTCFLHCTQCMYLCTVPEVGRCEMPTINLTPHEIVGDGKICSIVVKRRILRSKQICFLVLAKWTTRECECVLQLMPK